MQDKKPRKKCKKCKKYFTLQRDWQKFCGIKCRSRWHCAVIRRGKELVMETDDEILKD